jgi:hypothetical protein
MLVGLRPPRLTMRSSGSFATFTAIRLARRRNIRVGQFAFLLVWPQGVKKMWARGRV